MSADARRRRLTAAQVLLELQNLPEDSGVARGGRGGQMPPGAGLGGCKIVEKNNEKMFNFYFFSILTDLFCTRAIRLRLDKLQCIRYVFFTI